MCISELSGKVKIVPVLSSVPRYEDVWGGVDNVSIDSYVFALARREWPLKSTGSETLVHIGEEV